MQKETLQENKMGVMPVGKLLVNMALPMIISMLVQAFYNIVDSVYVSQVSESAVTALSLAFPVQNMQIGFAVGVGVGVNALLSQSLGRKNQESVNWAAGQGVFLALVATALFMLFGFFGVRPYYTMQSTVAETVEGGIAYTSICCIFTVGIFIQVLCERLLQATGRAMQTMILQGTGAIINIILDPVFIHGWWGMPKMGVAGAAVATVIGQCTGAVLGIYLNLRHNPEVQLHVKFMKPNWKVIAPILEVGIPSVVMNGIGSVMNFGMNQILQGFNEVATGVFGIYYKLQSLFFMPLFGINNATISILAFNYGARKPKRIVHTLKLATAVAVCIMLVGLAVFQLFPQALLGIFNPTEEFLAIGVKALRILCLPFPVAAICIALGASFQALGKGSYSTIVSLCRQLIVLLPVAYLLSLTGDVNNVWWSFPIAEVMSALVTGLLFGRLYRRKVKPLFEDAAE
ncbi:MAG: MATE family efflux transporter [Eubacteriales bacterium]|nr:MATE family efflux transporter [Eubacteriales bacterium]MDY6066242.1 MATE family efflux transporter [Candidatus Faecousia sp.]